MNQSHHFRISSRLLAALVCIAVIPCCASATDAPRTVVYEWNPSGFRSIPVYQGTPVTRATGQTAQCITALGAEWNNYIVVSPGKLKGGHEYTAILKYEIVTPPKFPGNFYMFARSKSLGQRYDIWQTWGGDAHNSGIARLSFHLKEADDWVFTVGCKGPAAQIIDSFQIIEGNGFAYLPAEKNPVTAVKPSPLPVATGAPPITIDPPTAKAGPVLSAKDFGLVADNPSSPPTNAVATENFAAIKRAIDACRQQGAARLVFPKGVYRFYSNEPIPFDKLNDLVIDGQDSEFIFEKIHGGVATINVTECNRCVMKNIRVDWDWTVTPLASLCRVVNATADGLTCDLAFPDLNEKEIELVKKAPWMGLTAMEPEFFRFKTEQILRCSVPQCTSLPDNVLQVTFKQPVPVVVGETYFLRHQYYEMPAFRIGDSSHLLFDNVTIYSMPGMGWTNRGEMSHWGFRNCKITRREGSRRPVTTTADGFHVVESLGNLLLENCEFTGISEDNINIHDNCFQGVERNDDHTLTLVGNPRWRFKVAVDHTIELFYADYSPIRFQSRINAVTYKGNDTILTLDEKLPNPLSPQTIVGNKHYHTSNVRIANCQFHGGGRILTSAQNLTIEDCLFDHTSMAVQLAVDITPPLWAEGSPASNIVLRRNTFESVNATGRVDGAAVCTFTRWPAGSTTSYPLYRDILIEKNRFVNTLGPTLSLRTCQNVVVRDNLIDMVKASDNITPMASVFFVEHSSDLKLGGNRWEVGAAAVKPGVLYDPETTSKLDAAGNILVRP